MRSDAIRLNSLSAKVPFGARAFIPKARYDAIVSLNSLSAKVPFGARR